MEELVSNSESREMEKHIERMQMRIFGKMWMKTSCYWISYLRLGCRAFSLSPLRLSGLHRWRWSLLSAQILAFIRGLFTSRWPPFPFRMRWLLRRIAGLGSYLMGAMLGIHCTLLPNAHNVCRSVMVCLSLMLAMSKTWMFYILSYFFSCRLRIPCILVLALV